MAGENLVTPFTRVQLFDGLSDGRVERIARCAERIVFAPGEVIQAEDDVPDAAVLVVSGKVMIVHHTKDESGELIAPGSLVGELAMLIETRAVTTVVARSSVRAFRIPRSELRKLMDSDPAIADHFVAKISERLTYMAAEMHRVDSMLASTIDKIPPPIPAHTPSPVADHRASAAQHLH